MLKKAPLNNNNLWVKAYPFIVAGIYLALGIILIIKHEFWVDEIRAWHIGSESGSIRQLVNTMQGDEGHPYLWNIILYFISHFITKNFESIKLIHLMTSTVTAFLILKYAPFNKIIRAMIVFGYFFFYEYSIISRNYALAILLVMVFCILYRNKHKNLIPLGITLFFMGQVNIFSFIISMTLFLFLFFELIKDWKYIRKDINKIHLSSAILVAVLEVLTIYLQLGSQIKSYSGSSVLSIFINPVSGYSGGVFRISRGIIGAYLPIPIFNLNFFNSNFIVDNIFKGSLIPTFILSLILFLIPVFIIKRRLILLYLSASIAIMFIPFYVYKCSLRHFGHFFIIFIICLWLSNIDMDHDYLIRNKKVFLRKFQIIFLVIILGLSIIGSGAASYYDYKYPFSNGKNVAMYVEKKFDKEEIVIIGYQDYAAETVAAYLDKDIYSPQSKSFQKLVGWPGRVKEMQMQEVFKEASKFTRQNDTVLVIISHEPVNNPEIYEKYYFKKMDIEFDNAIFPMENSYLYLFDRKSIINNSELLYEVDYTNFGDYWQELSQSEWIGEDNEIRIKVFGEDPYLESIFPIRFKNNNPILMIISLRTFAEGDLQIYYRREGRHYSEEDSDKFSLVNGTNNVYIEIPYSNDLERIRFDPINVKSDIYIKTIEIYSKGE